MDRWSSTGCWPWIHVCDQPPDCVESIEGQHSLLREGEASSILRVEDEQCLRKSTPALKGVLRAGVLFLATTQTKLTDNPGFHLPLPLFPLRCRTWRSRHSAAKAAVSTACSLPLGKEGDALLAVLVLFLK